MFVSVYFRRSDHPAASLLAECCAVCWIVSVASCCPYPVAGTTRLSCPAPVTVLATVEGVAVCHTASTAVKTTGSVFTSPVVVAVPPAGNDITAWIVAAVPSFITA